MISFGNAASSHSGSIPLKTAYSQEKRGIALGYRRKKNFINLHSAAFVTVFARNYKFRIFHNTAFFFYKFDNPEINR